jgi:hypothetical protein
VLAWLADALLPAGASTFTLYCAAPPQRWDTCTTTPSNLKTRTGTGTLWQLRLALCVALPNQTEGESAIRRFHRRVLTSARFLSPECASTKALGYMRSYYSRPASYLSLLQPVWAQIRCVVLHLRRAADCAPHTDGRRLAVTPAQERET